MREEPILVRLTAPAVAAVLACGLLIPAVGAARFVPVSRAGFAGQVTCVAEQDGRLWIGTRGAGLFAWDGTDRPALPAAPSLPGQRINGCANVAGTLWLAMDAGLVELETTGQARTWARGRALHVAADAHGVVAPMSDRTVVRVQARQVTRTAMDVLAMSMAVSADGRWAVGGFGALYTSELARAVSLPGPVRGAVVEDLSYGPDARLRLRVAGQTLAFDGRDFTVVHQPLRSDPPALVGTRVRARAHFRGQPVFATEAGAVRMDDRGRLRPIPLPGMPCGERVAALAVVGDALWVGGFDSGLCRLQAGRWERFAGPAHLPSDMVNDLTSDGERLFAATTAGLAIVHPDGRFEQFTHSQCEGALKGRCPWHASVTGVARDRERGRMWVADVGAVHGIRPKSGAWQHLARRAGLTSARITRLAAHGGVVAAGTVDQGVLVRRGGRFARLDDQAGLSDNWVTDLAFADDGSLWVATCTRGVTRVAGDGSIRRFGVGDGLVDDYTLAVVPFTAGEGPGRPGQAGVFVGTPSGLSIFSDGRVQNLTVADGLSGNEVHDVVHFDGGYWVATDAGLSVLAWRAEQEAAP